MAAVRGCLGTVVVSEGDSERQGQLLMQQQCAATEWEDAECRRVIRVIRSYVVSGVGVSSLKSIGGSQICVIAMQNVQLCFNWLDRKSVV